MESGDRNGDLWSDLLRRDRRLPEEEGRRSSREGGRTTCQEDDSGHGGGGEAEKIDGSHKEEEEEEEGRAENVGSVTNKEATRATTCRGGRRREIRFLCS